MIYELRTYTLRPGSQATVARTAGDLGRAIRGDDYGKLEGYWLSEIGPLNQVLHLWSFESLDERTRLRTALAANADWTGKYVPAIRPHLVRQEVRLMHAFLPMQPPATTGNVYELRSYRTFPTRARDWARLFTSIMPVREEYSRNVCAWVTESGQPNEVSHLWAYPSLDARAETRGRVVQDPRWQAFLAESGPMLEEMHSTILLPAAHSPLR
ncbi:MAG: NIPSNAP family protein [Ectothiorhodospiraceae bacterium]|nr:NIPSNAP family protein [Ectothiorhodospiraceae bacterium]